MDPDTNSNDILEEMMSAAKDSGSNKESSSLRDAALIINGNQVEHYEIAMYGSLVLLARQLGLQEAVEPLQETLQEEKAADAKVTQIAESSTNAQVLRHQTA